MRKHVNILFVLVHAIYDSSESSMEFEFVQPSMQCFFEVTRKAIALLHRHFDTYACIVNTLAGKYWQKKLWRIDFNLPMFFTAKVSYYSVNKIS